MALKNHAIHRYFFAGADHHGLAGLYLINRRRHLGSVANNMRLLGLQFQKFFDRDRGPALSHGFKVAAEDDEKKEGGRGFPERMINVEKEKTYTRIKIGGRSAE